MIVTQIYKGQGIGNQLWCYVVTRSIAADHGYDFGIQTPENFKGLDFLELDFGQKVLGGVGPDGGPPTQLPGGIVNYYQERQILHPDTGADIRIFDSNLAQISDQTKIDGVMQDEQYIAHRRDEIRTWLKIKPEFECLDYSDENTCVINFRGGEYTTAPEVFLKREYWDQAIRHMRERNPQMRFVVITDDISTGQRFFPHFPVHHFSIGKDYSIIHEAHYLILSNSSFAWLPAWTSKKLKFCIAPKYWARHNSSDGYWSCGYNLTSDWTYLDRNGQLSDYATCKKEFEEFKASHQDWFTATPIEDTFLVINRFETDISWIPRRTTHYQIYDHSADPVFPPMIDRQRVELTPNVGYNIYDYCTYIIDNYERLPDTIMFAKCNVFPRHVTESFFNKIANNKTFTPIFEPRLHRTKRPISFIDKQGLFNEINNSWYTAHHPTKYFLSLNDFLQFAFTNAIQPRYVQFAPGANYIVPKSYILQYPKIFYENIRTIVSHHQLAGEAHIIERALYTIWTAQYTASPQMLVRIENNFPIKKNPNPSIIAKLRHRFGF